jgi:hypothetical protein
MTTGTCAYCLQNKQLLDDQVLLRGVDLYLCAPRGQLVEGYLAIVPYQCIGSFSRMPKASFPELKRLQNVVLSFYERAYGVKEATTFYEQGRAGAGASVDVISGFPLHAHLCSLPLGVDLHSALASKFFQKSVSGPEELPVAARAEPYVYVEDMHKTAVYVANSSEGRAELAGMRLKPMIANLAGYPDRGNWRIYPGALEMQKLTENWRIYGNGDRHGSQEDSPTAAGSG